MPKAKIKEETIEKIVYSGHNDKVVYRELCKINGIPVKVDIRTDFCNNFGGTIFVLNKDTLEWKALYSIPNSFLEVYKDNANGYCASERDAEVCQKFYIEKFKKDTDDLKTKLIELLF